jgi:cell division protein FtsI (penicillin-binding protein 3)
MLTAVTEPGGTAVEAGVDGYLVAGKTGTAQKADYVRGGYAKDKWLASFIGFLPADEPTLVISVVIDEPVIAHYGGTVAGPVFRRIAEVTLRHMGITPEGRQAVPSKKQAQREAVVQADPEANTTPSEPTEKGESAVPDVRSLPLRQAVLELHGASLVAEVAGSGIVVEQEPPPGKAIPHGSIVRLSLAKRRFDEASESSEGDAPTLASTHERGAHAN